MPFTVTHDQPKVNSRITVKFAGLVLLRPNGADMCDIGIHRFTRTHLFQVLLVVNKPNLPPTVLRLTNGPLTGTFTMTANPIVTRFQAFTLNDDPFDPNAPGNDVHDYRWAINMRDLNPGIDFNEGAKPIASLNDGILYTSNLSKDGIVPVITRGGDEKRPRQIAADLSASIDLPDQGTFHMEWAEFGDSKEFTVPRRGFDPPETTYTIVFLNDPPVTDPSPHDELAVYYKVLQINGADVDDGERWKLIYDNADKSDEIPCPPTVLNP